MPDGADLVEAELAGRAVDERRAEEQRRRADRADDQVLEPRLERPDQVDVDRAQDVERDREPLERRGRASSGSTPGRRTPCRRRRRPAARSTRRRARRASARGRRSSTAIAPAAGDQHLRERGPAVAEHRVVRRCAAAVRALRVDDDREHERGRRSRRTRRTPRPPCASCAGTKTATISSRPVAASSASDGESANQSTCGLTITATAPRKVAPLIGCSPRCSDRDPAEAAALRDLRRAGPAERAAGDQVRATPRGRAGRATSGTTTASSPSAQVERGVAAPPARRPGAARPRSRAACTSPPARSRRRRRRPSPSPAGRRPRGSGTRRRTRSRAAPRAR